MRKQEIIKHWQNIPKNQQIKMMPVAYKHKGSTYDQDGIRLTGSQEFVDSLLSNIKQLLQDENDNTRLQLTYQETVDRETQLSTGTFNCYVQVHDRGHEAKMMNGFV